MFRRPGSLQNDLLIFRTLLEHTQCCRLIQQAAGEDPECIKDRIIGDRTDNNIRIRQPVFPAGPVRGYVLEPLCIPCEADYAQAFRIQFIGVEDRIGIFPEPRLPERKFPVLRRVEALSEIRILPAVVYVRLLYTLIACMVQLHGAVLLRCLPPVSVRGLSAVHI